MGTNLCDAETAVADQEGFSLSGHVPGEEVTIDWGTGGEILAISGNGDVVRAVLRLVGADWKSDVFPFYPDRYVEVRTAHLVDSYHA